MIRGSEGLRASPDGLRRRALLPHRALCALGKAPLRWLVSVHAVHSLGMPNGCVRRSRGRRFARSSVSAGTTSPAQRVTSAGAQGRRPLSARRGGSTSLGFAPASERTTVEKLASAGRCGGEGARGPSPSAGRPVARHRASGCEPPGLGPGLTVEHGGRARPRPWGRRATRARPRPSVAEGDCALGLLECRGGTP